MPDEREQRVARNGGQDAAQLQPDHQKEQTVQQENQHVPDGVGLQPGIGGEEARRLVAQVESCREHRQHPRHLQGIGDQVGGVGREQGNGDFDGRIVQVAMQPSHRPGDDEPDEQSAQADNDKLEANLRKFEAPGDHRCHGEAIDDEPGRVIDHTLALDHGYDAARQAQLFGDRAGSHGVGGGDDSPQDKGNRPGQASDDVGEGGDDERGHQDQTERQLQDRAQVRAECAKGGEPGRRVDQWWQKEHQDELRIECNVGKTWDKAKEQATKDEQNGIGQAQPSRQGGQHDNRHQQAKEQRYGS